MKKNNEKVVNDNEEVDKTTSINKEKVEKDEKREINSENKEIHSKTQVEILNEKIKALEKESFDWKNKYYEAFANLDNLRKQIEKDNEITRKLMKIRVVESFLPGLDNLEITLKMTPKDPVVKNFLIGTQMIFNTFQNSLQDLDFSSVEVKINDDFNSDTMNAIDIQEIEEGEENKVTQVYCRCYKFKDKVIRPANVVVTKLKQKQDNKQEDSKESQENK